MNAIAGIALSLCLSSASMAAGSRQAAGTRVSHPGDGVSAPAVVKEVKPQYTPEAMRAWIQGAVTLECVVQPDGTVGEARVTKVLNPGLDQEAIKAVRQWRFKPGLKDGKAVPVRITLEMTFTLRDTSAAGSATKPPLFPVRPPAPGDAGARSQPGRAPRLQTRRWRVGAGRRHAHPWVVAGGWAWVWVEAVSCHRAR